MKFVIFSFFGLLGLGSQAGMQDLVYNGSGCPADSAEITVDDQGTTLLFSSFWLDLTSRFIQRKTCNVAIPIDVPDGYKVTHGKITINGFKDLTENTMLTTNGEIFFAGTRGISFDFRSIGPEIDLFTHDLTPQYMWSACGQDVILRFTMSTILKNMTQDASEMPFAEIDSVRFEQPIFQKCN